MAYPKVVIEVGIIEREKVPRIGWLSLVRDLSPKGNFCIYRRITMSPMKQFRSWLVAAAIVMIPTAAWAEDARIAVAADAAHAEALVSAVAREHHIS